jgi:hypothetical protein
MIAFRLLNFRRCCTLRLEGKIQVGIIPICVSLEGCKMPCCIIVARLPTSACASRQALCVPDSFAFINLSSSGMPINGCSLAACGKLHLAFGRWGS